MNKPADNGSRITTSNLARSLVARSLMAITTLAASHGVGQASGIGIGDIKLPVRPRAVLDDAKRAVIDHADRAVLDDAKRTVHDVKQAIATAPGASGSGRPRLGSEQAAVRTAVITGDDYPAAWKAQDRDAFATPFGLNRECVSFVAWKIYRDAGGKKVPTNRNAPSDWATYSINVPEWKDAGQWARSAATHGIQVDHHPTVGSVAQWNIHTEIGMMVGHVGMVKAVNGDGSIDIEQYNLRENGKYSVLHMAKNSKATDRSNGNGPWTIPWPDNFIHVHGR